MAVSLIQDALAAQKRGALTEAERMLRSALQGADRVLAAAYLCAMLKRTTRFAEAEDVLVAAIARDPDAAGLHSDLGALRQDLGRSAEAIAPFREAIRLRPGFAEAFYNMGNALRDTGQLAEAAEAFVRSAELRPNLAEAHNNLGNLHFGTGDHAGALPHYTKALAIRPSFADARFNMGNALKALGRFEAALAAYTEVGRHAPNHASAYNNAGEVLEKLDRVQDAAHCYARSRAIDPKLHQPHRNLGTLMMRGGRMAEALQCFTQTVALQPRWAEGLASLVHCKCHICEWEGLDDLLLRLRDAARLGGLVPPFITATLPIPSDEQTAAATRWAATMDVPVAQKFPPRPPERGARIRVGYLSGDLHAHATAYLTAELFELHDRSGFEIIGYSFGPDDDSPMRKRLAGAFDSFVDLRGLSDLQAAELIREDAVDILVDLKGYTEGARARILAYRPAPIQVNWLGFPGSMGASFVDYVIADRIAAPERFQKDCVERIVALPDCFQPNDTHRPQPGVPLPRASNGLPETGFVFCSFNNSYKIMQPIFDLWMRVLDRVPGSVLWMLQANSLVEANLKRAAAARGVAPDRLIFGPRVPLADHITRLASADLFLDTVPVNALTTASDALWAGLPIVTLLGDTVAGRGCASLLDAVGLPELVTETPEAYEALAVRLATNAAALRALRKKLLANRLTTPLFDTPRFTANLEAAYRHMVDLWVAGEAPQAFGLDPIAPKRPAPKLRRSRAKKTGVTGVADPAPIPASTPPLAPDSA